jgi:hypothetical protein
MNDSSSDDPRLHTIHICRTRRIVTDLTWLLPRDYEATLAYFQKIKPTHVIHLAALGKPAMTSLPSRWRSKLTCLRALPLYSTSPPGPLHHYPRCTTNAIL